MLKHNHIVTRAPMKLTHVQTAKKVPFLSLVDLDTYIKHLISRQAHVENYMCSNNQKALGVNIRVQFYKYCCTLKRK